ncbi:MAG: orotidine 5'-phosphate decarboxylase / HUMPS family protein [Candidatus Thorarchaeota archaeon]
MAQTYNKDQHKPKLQIALDFENLDEALALAREVAPFVDIFEVGTPLIISEGMRAPKALKEAHPDKLVCADLKTTDCGYLEVKMAAQAKASIITVLADAYEVTIKEALRAANDFNVEIMADFIVSRSPVTTLAGLIDLKYKEKKIHYALVHSGLDQQASRRAPLFELEAVARLREHPRLAIAGGIRVTDIANILKFPVDIIIVGGGITRAKNPYDSAREIREAINKYSD